jgi:drug/metabolite transporter (DMT)-like permease
MLSSFYGNQLVLNVSMYVTLRKLVLVMIFFLDFFWYKKPIKLITIFCVFLITIGTVLVSMDDFTFDYFGYFVVIINNTLTLIYIEFSETFKKKTKVTNLKLLVYNSYLSNPILILMIFISGEYLHVYNYFCDNNVENNFYYGFILFLFISCTLCVILNSSFLLSNEKNSSLFTQLLSNSKDILFSFLSYFVFKNNKLTLRIIIGLIISTFGALLISMKSISENLILDKKKDKEKEEEVEMEDKEKV